MKKLLLSVFLTILPMLASAQTIEIDGIWYVINTLTNTAEVSQAPSKNKYSGDIIIPEKVVYNEIDYPVTSIGNSAFSECRDLISIIIPNSVTSIGKVAFEECEGLISVSLPNSLRFIGGGAFARCVNLKSVTLPSSLQYIEDCAFSQCHKMENVYCYANEPPYKYNTITYGFFYSTEDHSTLHVPKLSLDKYRNDKYWNGFKYYSALPEDDPLINPIDEIGGHEYVDLGLPSGRLWAKTNYGAYSEDDSGEYINWNNRNVVSQNWGSDWGVPTYEDLLELYNNCDYYWTYNKKEILGCVFKGRNGNSIFLPASGYWLIHSYGNVGFISYWTDTKSATPNYARCLTGWKNEGINPNDEIDYTQYLLPIRPVVKSKTADRDIPEQSQEMSLIVEKDWQNCDEFDIFECALSSFDQSVTATIEGLAIYNPYKLDGEMLPSATILKNLKLYEGGNYLIRIFAKIPSDGKLVFRLDNITDIQSTTVEVVANSEFQMIDAYYPSYPCFNKYTHLELFCGSIEGTVIVQKVQVFGTITDSGEHDSQFEQEDEPQDDVTTHEYVDLGLPSGNLWAKTNVGAVNEYDYGNYYAYGETQTKNYYLLGNYKWYDQDYNKYTKYGEEYNNVLHSLLEEDDVAAKKWGKMWHTPIHSDYIELLENCTSTWEEKNGVWGRKLTGVNGNSVFFPAAGFVYSQLYNQYINEQGYYMSSNNDRYENCFIFYFSRSEMSDNWFIVKYQGYSVRPVTNKANTKVGSVFVDNNEIKEIYDLRGLRKKNLSKGINILKTKNGKTIKRIVK